MTPISDSEPFDRSSVAAFELGLTSNQAANSRALAEARSAMRQRVDEWAAARGFEVVESGLTCTAESVEVAVEFSSSTLELCALRCDALQATELHVQMEPKSWTDWVAARLGRGFATADQAFDEHWHVATDHAEVAKRLLDARVRMALTSFPIWCRVAFDNGRIELQLDSGKERLTGEHLLGAIEIAVALARADTMLATAPYR